MKVRKALSVGSAMALIALFGSMLSGCITIPLRGRVEDEKAPSDVVRADDFVKLTKVGVTTRKEIRNRLGLSLFRIGDDQDVYTYQLRTGVFVAPLCFYAVDVKDEIAVRVAFEPNDTLTGYEITLYRNRSSYMGFPAPSFQDISLAPDEVLFCGGRLPARTYRTNQESELKMRDASEIRSFAASRPKSK